MNFIDDSIERNTGELDDFEEIDIKEDKKEIVKNTFILFKSKI